MRILYGVGGEGNGHAMRSHAVISYLLAKGHTVEICTSGIGEKVLAPLAPIHRIPRVPLVYRHGAIAYVRSIAAMLPLVLRRRSSIRKVCAICRAFKPDVVISDYETFTAAAANRMHIPLIAANNISVVAHTRYAGDAVPDKVFALWIKIAEQLATRAPDHVVLPTFFPAVPLRKNISLSTPPIRKKIRALRVTHKGPVLVYQTSSSNMQLLEALRHADIACNVYGYGKRKSTGKLSFFAFNEKRFLHDLAHARAVIAGGGFTLITEAIFLKKPLLCVPLRRHYEQCLNASMVQLQGYGKLMIAPNEKAINDFFSSLPHYRKNLSGIVWDPDAYAKEIDRVARNLIKNTPR